jgi:DNA-binding FadR family transcriptional regulator
LTADIGFHSALLSELKSPRLSRLYGSLMGEVNLCMAQVQAHRLLHPQVILEEHIAIVEAVQAGDRNRALREVDQHLNRASSQLVAFLKSDGQEAEAQAEAARLAAGSETSKPSGRQAR